MPTRHGGVFVSGKLAMAANGLPRASCFIPGSVRKALANAMLRLPQMRKIARLAALLAAAALASQPVAAQSILRDAETEALLHDMAAPLIVAAGLDPRNVDIVLINDPRSMPSSPGARRSMSTAA